jgi:hypothetical protein
MADLSDYPPEWPLAAHHAKNEAGWRCVRCGHRHEKPFGPYVPCDALCRSDFHPESFELFPRPRRRVLTVHHLDGQKANLAWWNLAALCQVCHLLIQGVTLNDAPRFYSVRWLRLEPWAVPFAAGYYANRLLAVPPVREVVLSDLGRFLALGSIPLEAL